MLPRTPLSRLSPRERANFLLTNRIPRRCATLFMGWFSRLRNPLVRHVSIAVWELFAGDLRLHEARKARFASMHDCFIRELKPGARPVAVDPGVLISPCDGVIGAFGAVRGTEVFQTKGLPYTLAELLGDNALAARYRDGVFVTLRLKTNMYHRFHAPEAGNLREVRYLAGDTWNVNPIAVKCIERLYCRNARAVLELHLYGSPHRVALVPVGAILVASIVVHGLDMPLDLHYHGRARLPCPRHYERGGEMGYFQQGSTIIVLAGPGFALVPDLREGVVVRMGQPLLVKPRTG
ncbi:MAG: archaetidylserine decarboxylase [Nitrococcus sp.]|nr:archaetidylserine decarboxylase [Nitrococcus sp.]